MPDGSSTTTRLGVEALVASTRHKVVGCSWPVISAVAFNAAQEVLAAEIAEIVGCAPDVAGVAAGAFLNRPKDALQTGFNDWPTGKYGLFSNARIALRLWMEERGVG